MTQMRGTRGFGAVILEVACGRKNLDQTQPEEDDILLLPRVKQKAEENRLIELVDKCSEDMQQHVEEVVETIRIGIWCLHNDPPKRPSMSMMGGQPITVAPFFFLFF
ncbi:serine-threonine protein kinase, plant-type, putative [Ricinus communis]|uniref:Serine-threonine protein kinase, plant-type, putative n=1 Tax=Ricinus communis TaxID=3988 RepID=B9RQK3_RICCO|nr:serine-threonine protein kinase, plant-type, putative [Ricinus communis]